MKWILPELIETHRCRLRPFERADLDDLFLLYGDPKVMTTRKIGVQNKDQTAAQLQEFLSLWQERGFGLYAVFEKDKGTLIGECGFRPYAPDHPDLIEISYGLRPQFWGGGIATEIATAMISAGFDGFSTDILIAHAQTQNAASLRVLNKLGFERCDERTLCLPVGLARCELSRDSWLREKGETQ
jgi:ribosomal-protein-alanine N-acetyltransferase